MVYLLHMFIIIAPWLFRKNFIGMAIYPFIFLKNKSDKEQPILLNHEKIHLYQQRELFVIPFYIFYCLEYLCRIFQYKFKLNLAYRNISFEREAYHNQCNLNYLNERKSYAFKHYL